MGITKELNEKYEELKSYLASLGSAAVAFSSGVDSTFLLYAAKEALGDKVIAITLSSGLFPNRELTESKAFCESIGVTQQVIVANELEIEGFAENPSNRCYLCKKDLFGRMIQCAKEHQMAAVLEGSNVDDEGDYRPGMQAVKELGVLSPLRKVRLTKAEIRELSKEFKLPTWSKPSFACIASRFPYGEIITEEKLHMVDDAEQYLLEQGFLQFRVRIHGTMARIELLSEDFPKLMEESMRIAVYQKLKAIGFSYISLDLLGYRTGSMNEVISK